MTFLNELEKRILVLDGSMGALLQARGLPAGMAPDVWMMSNPDRIFEAHQEYVQAGADILLTNTFGASKWRLAEYDSYSSIYEINAKAFELARKAAGERAFVAGDIGPSGETVYPTGEKSFEETAEIFYEQARILTKLGVDLIVVETMFDSLEYRASLSGIRAASSSIPIIAHATFNHDGITDTGASPENIAAIAEGFHVSALGVNCSIGPQPMVDVVKRFVSATYLPVSVQPNAGLPKIIDGKTAFPMTPNEMGPYVDQFLSAGARIIGGCCGTTPEFIRIVKDKSLRSKVQFSPVKRNYVSVSSLSKSIKIGTEYPFVPIGERMNPSGRKKLSESLKGGNLSMLIEDAVVQLNSGANLLDLNVGVPLVDEPELMKKAVVGVQNKVNVPLMIDSSNTFALDRGASVFYGRPLLNSLNAEDEKLEEAIPIFKKHGAAAVCMLTGIQVPVTAEERIKNAEKIVDILIGKHGFHETDIVFDCLGLVVSAMQEGSRETLRTIEMVKSLFPASATTLGLSNVSFGLPNRAIVHNTFLALAVNRGLDCAIMSVTDPLGKVMAASSKMWNPDRNAIEYFVNNFAQKVELGGPKASGDSQNSNTLKDDKQIKEPDFLKNVTDLERDIFRSIVDGKRNQIVAQIERYVAEKPEKAMDLFINVMTPAIRYLGDLFGARIKFIPHLIAAADTMKEGVGILEPLLAAERSKQGTKRETIVFATVKGDIHDIGKNICILMLKNFG